MGSPTEESRAASGRQASQPASSPRRPHPRPRPPGPLHDGATNQASADPRCLPSGPGGWSRPVFSHGRVGVDQVRFEPADAMLDQEGPIGRPSTAPRRGAGRPPARALCRSGARAAGWPPPRTAAWPKRTRVSVSASRPSASRCCVGSGGAGGLQVRQAVHHGHVGDAQRPGQLERGLQPACRGQVVQDGPGLIHHHHALRCPRGRARMAWSQPVAQVIEHGQRGRARIPPTDPGRRPEASRRRPRRSRPVKHAGQVALDQPAQLQRHQTAVVGQAGGVGAHRRRPAPDPGPARPHHIRKRGFGARGRARPSAARSTAVRSGRGERSSQRGRGQRARQLRLPAPSAGGIRPCGSRGARQGSRRAGCRPADRPGAGSSGLSRIAPAGRQAERRAAARLGQGPYSPLGSTIQA